jgi:hypothetical protein
MRPRQFGLILASALCVAAAGPAHAVICYVVYDRNENVVYQNTYPPVDMSNAGLAQRDALRARGEHLTFGDVPQCPNVVFLTGVGGMSDIKVDEVVAGMPVRTLSGATATGVINRTPVTPSAAAAPAPPPKTRSSY